MSEEIGSADEGSFQEPLFERGEVVWVDLRNLPIVEHELGKFRPAVNVQWEVANEGDNPNVTIVPFTTTGGIVGSDTHIEIGKGEGGITEKSYALCDNITTVSKTRVKHRIGQLSTDKMNMIYKAISIHLDIL